MKSVLEINELHLKFVYKLKGYSSEHCRNQDFWVGGAKTFFYPKSIELYQNL